MAGLGRKITEASQALMHLLLAFAYVITKSVP